VLLHPGPALAEARVARASAVSSVPSAAAPPPQPPPAARATGAQGMMAMAAARQMAAQLRPAAAPRAAPCAPPQPSPPETQSCQPPPSAGNDGPTPPPKGPQSEWGGAKSGAPVAERCVVPRVSDVFIGRVLEKRELQSDERRTKVAFGYLFPIRVQLYINTPKQLAWIARSHAKTIKSRAAVSYRNRGAQTAMLTTIGRPTQASPSSDPHNPGGSAGPRGPRRPSRPPCRSARSSRR